ncbi:hypothetical protein [Promicromonospora sukumoe]|uniref:hypothetical protein n=1 Tax=Promicromonospora sukumoe TaxID=88382 RepID=UPI0003607188|nr:hypothetical protein [Promicromonospora sukumoe]
MVGKLKGKMVSTIACVVGLAAASLVAVSPVMATAATGADGARAAAVASSDSSAGILATSCKVGTGWTAGDNPNSRNYAWASCYDTNPVTRPWNEFRVEWSCTGEGYMRYGAWTYMNNQRASGTCPLGKRVDVNRVGTRYVGP